MVDRAYLLVCLFSMVLGSGCGLIKPKASAPLEQKVITQTETRSFSVYSNAYAYTSEISSAELTGLTKRPAGLTTKIIPGVKAGSEISTEGIAGFSTFFLENAKSSIVKGQANNLIVYTFLPKKLVDSGIEVGQKLYTLNSTGGFDLSEEKYGVVVNPREGLGVLNKTSNSQVLRSSTYSASGERTTKWSNLSTGEMIAELCSSLSAESDPEKRLCSDVTSALEKNELVVVYMLKGAPK